MENPGAPALPPAVDFGIDLRAEARQFIRQRTGIIVVGLGLGAAFIGIGFYELVLLTTSPALVDFGVSLLLVLLGGSLIYLSLRSGLLNPATSLKGTRAGLTLERRWRGPVTLAWTDPAFFFEVEDLSPDPESSPEERRHMFFSGPGPVYGSLPPPELGPLLDQARARGLLVRIKQDEVKTGRKYHLIRRVRIRPARTK